MSSSDSSLPLYSATSTPAWKSTTLGARDGANRTAGTIQTCSIKDFCVDYLQLVRESPTYYSVCLTIDPTPIYRVEFATGSTNGGDIQIFPASDTALPAIAAARLSINPKSKTEPFARICTDLSLPRTIWRPMERKSSWLGETYSGSIRILTVPGMAPVDAKFEWEVGVMAEPFFQLWWDGPLPLVPKSRFMHDQRGPEYIFCTMARKVSEKEVNLIEIRRGGGLEFDLTVLLQLFAILRYQKKPLV